MNIDIQAEAITPRRHTFSHIARRFGKDQPASRYEEATYDVQAVTNFHYRPTYAPEFELYDPRRTKIVMADWYVFRDPRQFYYATYNINRAVMQQSFDDAVNFVDKRRMLEGVDPAWRDMVGAYLLPLRHLEWAANMHCQLIADWGYGAQITSAAAFCGADRLGLAQVISRIGLALGGGTEDKLLAAKQAWLEAPQWQELRHLAEDMMVVHDWFELLVAQMVVLDGLVYPLITGAFDKAGSGHNGAALSMMTMFLSDWYADNTRWIDAVLKAAAAESDANRGVLNGWLAHWGGRSVSAMSPVAAMVLNSAADASVNEVRAQLQTRLKKFSLSLEKENVA